jgi:hypothetical protein
MKSSLLLLFVLVLSAFSNSLFAQNFFSDSGYSSVTIRRDTAPDGGAFIDQRVKTLSYHLEHYWNNGLDTSVLIAEASVQHSQSNLEGEEGMIELNGRISEGVAFNRTAWNQSLRANLIEYEPDYWVATDYGCCGAENVKRIYRYSDGAPLMTLTSDVGEVSIPNSRTRRYVGYWDVTNSTEESDIKDSLLLGILTMVDPDNLKEQRMTVTLRNPKYSEVFGVNPFDTLSFGTFMKKDSQNYSGGRTFDLWSQDGNPNPTAYTNFSIKLKFEFAEEGSTTVEIPVRAGVFDISNLHSKWFDFQLR